jgi:hypothetical protein
MQKILFILLPSLSPCASLTCIKTPSTTRLADSPSAACGTDPAKPEPGETSVGGGGGGGCGLVLARLAG